MPKAQTTRQISNEHESFLEKVFAKWNARRSPSSGARFSDPIDVTTDLHVIEAKATEGKSISIKREDWIKNRNKAYNGRMPAMAIRFRDPYNGKHIDLLLVELENDYLEKIDPPKRYHEERYITEDDPHGAFGAPGMMGG